MFVWYLSGCNLNQKAGQLNNNPSLPSTNIHPVRELIEDGDFHGRPYRKYSDGTVKAVTSAGWRKFQSFDELCEYHWKNHYKKNTIIKKSKIGWLKRIFNPAHNKPNKI